MMSNKILKKVVEVRCNKIQGINIWGAPIALIFNNLVSYTPCTYTISIEMNALSWLIFDYPLKICLTLKKRTFCSSNCERKIFSGVRNVYFLTAHNILHYNNNILFELKKIASPRLKLVIKYYFNIFSVMLEIDDIYFTNYV